jgi:hypothetical protein
VFRFNNRSTKSNPVDDTDRFMLAVSQIAGKRLTYAELTGKMGKTEPFYRSLEGAPESRKAETLGSRPSASIRLWSSGFDTFRMSRIAWVNLANSGVLGGFFMEELAA